MVTEWLVKNANQISRYVESNVTDSHKAVLDKNTLEYMITRFVQYSNESSILQFSRGGGICFAIMREDYAKSNGVGFAMSQEGYYIAPLHEADLSAYRRFGFDKVSTTSEMCKALYESGSILKYRYTLSDKDTGTFCDIYGDDNDAVIEYLTRHNCKLEKITNIDSETDVYTISQNGCECSYVVERSLNESGDN